MFAHGSVIGSAYKLANGRLLIVKGEAGTGKTRLLHFQVDWAARFYDLA